MESKHDSNTTRGLHLKLFLTFFIVHLRLYRSLLASPQSNAGDLLSDAIFAWTEDMSFARQRSDACKPLSGNPQDLTILSSLQNKCPQCLV